MGDMAAFEVDALASKDASGVLVPLKIARRKPTSQDVVIKILYCGICHSDLHQIKNDWGNTIFPVVPGHEITGQVTEVGSDVTKFKEGDRVGVGCLVGSCTSCDACDQGLENYCDRRVLTYNSSLPDSTYTYGGYSACIVVDQSFVIKIPENLPLDAAAPLLCAGITVYSPMINFGMTEKGKNFGVVGLGGLGHMAVKFAKAFGLNVTVISTSPSKEKEAKESLGADSFIVSTNPQQMKEAIKTLDYIVDTVSAAHEITPLLSLLKLNGKLVLVGLPSQPMQLISPMLIFGRKTVAGSLMGGIKETQEMMDLCGEKNISVSIERVTLDYVNTAMERLAKSDVKYRFVIDVANSLF